MPEVKPQNLKSPLPAETQAPAANDNREVPCMVAMSGDVTIVGNIVDRLSAEHHQARWNAELGQITANVRGQPIVMSIHSASIRYVAPVAPKA